MTVVISSCHLVIWLRVIWLREYKANRNHSRTWDDPHQLSQCVISSTGRRLAGLKSVPVK